MNQDLEESRRGRDTERPDDFRTPYHRDHARLIHSAAFRRMQAKTQVLGLGESDFYRTRLTHSMEVAQIGTGINYKLKSDNPALGNVIAPRSLMNTICLAHDIGHPPFGHGGEVALNQCMRNHGGFEGNGQTLRILSKLDKYSREFGLNPTRRMLLGILKYPKSYTECCNSSVYLQDTPRPSWLFRAEHATPPKCHLDSETDVVDFISEGFSESDWSALQDQFVESANNHRKPSAMALDASIMDLADDISYGIHDLEDAVELGLVNRDDWTSYCTPILFQQCEIDFDEITHELFCESSSARKNAIGTLINRLITRVYIGKSSIPECSDPLLAFNACLPNEDHALLEHVKCLVREIVIKTERVQQLEFKGQKLVVEAFEVLASDPERLLPQGTRDRYIERDKDIRVICDYVAGMTDDYITRLYEKLFVPRRGSIFDQI